MIDSIVLSVFVLILFYDQLMALSMEISVANTPESMQQVYADMAAFNRQILPYVFLLYTLYHGVLVWQSGMTLGKYMMKLKVIQVDGGDRLTLSAAIMRGVIRTMGELFLFYLTFLTAFFTPQRQTLHDRMAKSIVIDMRQPE